MNWLPAIAAPAVVGAAFLACGRIHPAILAYHVLCAVLILRNRTRIRPLLHPIRVPWKWALGTTALFTLFLIAGPLLVSPEPYRDLFRRILFPSGNPSSLFVLFAAYSLGVHVPIEEMFWRAVVLNPERDRPSLAILGQFLCFGALHAVPLGLILGYRGILYSVPAGAAGAIWTALTIRTRTLWPALVSHWGADLVILGGMWFFFIR